MAHNKKRRIYIAGHSGLVGSALIRYFSNDDGVELILATRRELDLINQFEVNAFFENQKPDEVIIAAGRVGGIKANEMYPAEFGYQNLMIESNIIHASWKAGVTRLLNFGSSCAYPKESPQPMTPDQILTGSIEPTNEPYAIAKIAGMSLCNAYNKQYGTRYINAIPSNLYGPNDSFNLDECHVISAFIKRFHAAKKSGAKEIELWGSGSAKRDFLFVDDFASACDLLLTSYNKLDLINVGAAAPCTIFELSTIMKDVVGFDGDIKWDKSKPDGNPERALGADEIKMLGWNAQTNLRDGLEQTYNWFLDNYGGYQ